MRIGKKAYKWWYDHVQSRYYNLLIKWVFLPFGGEKRFRQKILEPVEFSQGEKVLDMCCGTGGASFAIAQKAGSDAAIIGMDLSSGQLEAARRNCPYENIRFMQGDVTRTDFEDASFDRVFITHAIHEMRREDRLKTLGEAKRLLRHGGKVVILELDDPDDLLTRLFIGFWIFYWLPFNFETPTRRDMLKHGLENEVREAGFINVKKTSKNRGVFQVVEGEKQGQEA